MERIKNFNRDHFNNEEEHKKVNRYIEITAAYIQTFIPNQAWKILDVGAADGELSKHLKAKVESIDIEPATPDIKAATISDMPLKYYDMIVYNHVLEHIEDIYGEIRRAIKSIKDDGYLFIACPDASSPWAYELDAHISMINRYTIKKFCDMFDLKLIEQSYHCFRDNRLEIWNMLQK